MSSLKTDCVAGLVIFVTFVIFLQWAAADTPYVKEGAPTEVSFNEDRTYLDLNLYDVFADDDPEDAQLDLTNFEVEGLYIFINQTTGLVDIYGDRDFHGQVEVVFRAMDGRGYFADHELTVIVLPVNDPPETVGKISRESWDEGDDHHFNISAFFHDVDGDDLFYFAKPQPDSYTWVNADGDPRNPWFDIICQDPFFYGYIQVLFTAYDKDPAVHGDEALSAETTAIFEVTGENSPPRVTKFEPNTTDVEIKEMESATFKVLEVWDPDSAAFRYKWFVDGKEAEGHTSDEFRYPLDPSYQTAGVYEVSVEVLDNLGERSWTPLVWTLTIIDVNRRPTVSLVVREVRVPYREVIILEATAIDLDGDDLTFRWFRLTEDDMSKEVGGGEWFVYGKDPEPGRHYFRCEVDDGKDPSMSDWMLVTVEPKDTPGPSGTLASFALLIAFLALTIASRRRGRDSKAY